MHTSQESEVEDLRKKLKESKKVKDQAVSAWKRLKSPKVHAVVRARDKAWVEKDDALASANSLRRAYAEELRREDEVE